MLKFYVCPDVKFNNKEKNYELRNSALFGKRFYGKDSR